MTITTNVRLFQRTMMWFEALTHYDHRLVLARARMSCLTFDSFSFEMHCQTEAVMVKML